MCGQSCKYIYIQANDDFVHDIETRLIKYSLISTLFLQLVWVTIWSYVLLQLFTDNLSVSTN